MACAVVHCATPFHMSQDVLAHVAFGCADGGTEAQASDHCRCHPLGVAHGFVGRDLQRPVLFVHASEGPQIRQERRLSSLAGVAVEPHGAHLYPHHAPIRIGRSGRWRGLDGGLDSSATRRDRSVPHSW